MARPRTPTNNDAIRLPRPTRTVRGVADRSLISDGLMIRFDEPDGMTPGDRFVVRAPNGGELDMFFGSIRPDGLVSVWYAPHPVLRHWLGWLEPLDAVRWRFRMEPYHREWLGEFLHEFRDMLDEGELPVS